MLHTVPIDLKEANAIIDAWHRHHVPAVGHRYSIGCIDDEGVLHGVCIVGRPVARMAGHPRDVAEVTRLATDGTKNACSILYAAAARMAEAQGFLRIQTYILESEPGTSLRAVAWENMGPTSGGFWAREGRPRRTDQPSGVKIRWERRFADRPQLTSIPENVAEQMQLDLDHK